MHIRYRLFSSKETLKMFLIQQKKRFKSFLLFQNPFFIVALFIFSLIPFLCAVLIIKGCFAQMQADQNEFDQIKWRAKRFVQTQKSRIDFLTNYEKADFKFFNEQIEQMTFMKNEIKVLEVMSHHSAFHSCPIIYDRLHHLTNEGNRLVFVENEKQSSSLVEEKHLRQKKPVEVSGEDVKTILAQVEGIRIEDVEASPFRPQVIVKRFELKREQKYGKENFLLNFDLISREPSKQG